LGIFGLFAVAGLYFQEGKVLAIRGTTDGWQMHYRRMVRSFDRLQRPYNNTEVHDDDLHHFFQDAWHLKDWINNDTTVPETIRHKIWKRVHEDFALRVAADLANGTKHLLLTKKLHENARFLNRQVIACPGQDLRFVWTIETSKGKFIAEEMVHNVKTAWDKIIESFHLSTELPI
jgi:hypothetical protein